MSTKPWRPELKFNRYDLLVAAIIAALAVAVAVAFYGSRTGTAALTVVIRAGGEEIRRAPLSSFAEETFHRTQGGRDYHYRVVGDGTGVWMEESTCPTQDCVHTGRITGAGQSIVCLPGQVVIHLEGTPESGVPDVTVG